MKQLELTPDEKTALKTPLEQISPSATKGFTIKDLRQIDKLCKILEAPEATVNFEDADFDFLKKRFEVYDGWLSEGRAVILGVADKLTEAVK